MKIPVSLPYPDEFEVGKLTLSNLRGAVNVQTLSGNKTLTVSDYVLQWLDPGGADRDVVLPAEASSTNLLFIILNTADGAGEDLVVKNAAAATKATLGPGMSGIFSCDGTNWKWENATDFKTDVIAHQTILPLSNTPATPALAFGDGDSGFYESADDDLYCSIAGVAHWRFIASGLQGVVSGVLMRESIASATNPNFCPSSNDQDTGIGTAGADQLSLIAGGVEGHRITEAAGAIDHVLTGIVKTPTTQTLTGAGAVDIVSAITHLVTAGAGADALTLADGAEGQMKTIIMKTITTGGDTSVITPTNFANGTTITFDGIGDIEVLMFSNGSWHQVGRTGTVIG